MGFEIPHSGIAHFKAEGEEGREGDKGCGPFTVCLQSNGASPCPLLRRHFPSLASEQVGYFRREGCGQMSIPICIMKKKCLYFLQRWVINN